MENSAEILEALGIDTFRISKELTRIARIKKFPIQDFTEEKIRNAFLSGIEVELEDVGNERSGTRITIGKKNYRIKNIKRNLKYFVFALIYSVKVDADLSISNITDIIFLLIYIFDMIKISLSSDEAFVFWHIFRASEEEPVTDRNLVALISKAIDDDSYSRLSEEKIRDIVKDLIEKDMLIKEEDWYYDVTDRNTLPWQ